VKVVKQTTDILNFFVEIIFEGVSDVLFDRIELVIIQTLVRQDLENGAFFRVLNCNFCAGTYLAAEHQLNFNFYCNFIVVESCVWQQHKRGLNNFHWCIVLFFGFGLFFSLFLLNFCLWQG